MREVVIAGAVRTAIGRFGGAIALGHPVGAFEAVGQVHLALFRLLFGDDLSRAVFPDRELVDP